MTEPEAIARLQAAFDDLSRWRHGIDIARSAEAERMSHIDETLKAMQGDLKGLREESNGNMKKVFWLVGALIIGLLFRWIVQGNLAGAL